MLKTTKIDDIESVNQATEMTEIDEDKNITPNHDDKSEHVNDDSDKKFIQNMQEEDFEPLPEKQNKLSVYVGLARSSCIAKLKKYKSIIYLIFGLICFLLYLALFIWFLICKSRIGELTKYENNIRFIWISCLIFLLVIYKCVRFIIRCRKVSISACFHTPHWWDKAMRILFYVFCTVASLLILAYIIYSAVVYDPYNLVSISGIIILLLLTYIFSFYPHMINWQPVLLGLLMQFIFAWLILATNPGYEVFKFLGDRVADFLKNVEDGVIFVFGKDYTKHLFAFGLLPIIIFMSAVTAMLYYWGVIQFIVVVLGTAMQKFLGTTCGESLNVVANIFLGMTESPLLIRPLLGSMTNSELHAVMTGGFATIAGSVLATYIKFGAPANHLISASVMSAPAAMAVSKLMYPETKKSKTSPKDAKNLPKSPYNNLVEAITVGAIDSIPIISAIAASVICFLSILSFFNSIVAWLGTRACLPFTLTFEVICSYLFWPLSFIMGVKFDDCLKVAELIGMKTFLNEFIAYEKIKVLISNKAILDTINTTVVSVSHVFGDTILNYPNGTEVILKGGVLQHDRSLVIATYSLCGFANFGSMGILLSSLCTLIPHRRKDLSQMILSSMIAGNIACFLTASIAGVFYRPPNL